MSDRVVQIDNDTDGPSGQSVQSYQSVWMAHWNSTTCKTAPKVHNRLLDFCENKEDDCDAKPHLLLKTVEIASDISKCGERFREVSNATTVNAIEGGRPMSMKASRNESLCCQTFPMFNPHRNRESNLGQKNDPTVTHKQVLWSQVGYESGYDAINSAGKKRTSSFVCAGAPPEEGTSSRDHRFQPEVSPQNAEQQVQVHSFNEMNSLAVSKSLPGEFIGPSSSIVPYQFNNGKTMVLPLRNNQESVNLSNFISASKEHFKGVNLTQVKRDHYNYESCTTFFVCEKQMQNQVKCGNSKLSLFRKNGKDMLLNDAPMRNKELAPFLGEQWQKMSSADGIELSLSHGGRDIVGELEKLNHGSHSLQRIPCSVSAQDVETMRICTSVDSLDGLGRCPLNLCQADRVVMTNKNDSNLPKGSSIFRDSKLSPENKALLHLSPGFGSPGWHGVKLQPMEDSGNSQVKDVRGVKISSINSKNESSAETNTMNVDGFPKDNHPSGVASSPLKKGLVRSKNQETSAATISSAREFRGGVQNQPDMNEELPALPAPATSMDDKEASTSRTQSLDADHILAHAEEPVNSKWSPHPDGSLELDPSNRWVKRLRMCDSDSFAHGTKTSKMGETSSNEKVNKFFSKIMKRKVTSSEFTPGGRPGKEPMGLDQTAEFLRNGNSSSSESVRKSQDITLSHSWIQRWCRNPLATPKKKPEAMVVCEPQSSKVGSEELQKKQFPSIAAMALMGKALTSFRPCEFRKRGALVVWDAKGSEMESGEQFML